MPMPPAKTQTVRFPAYLHIVPIIALVLVWSGLINPDNLGLSLFMLLANAGVFCYQLYFLKTLAGPHRLLKAEKHLLIGSPLILGGLLMGHISGHYKFSTDPSLQNGIYQSIIVYFVLLLLSLLILSLINAIYLYIHVGTILQAIAKVGLFFLWLAIFALAFIGYGISYTLHDPNTE